MKGSLLNWLPGQDSNLRPAGYKCSNLSTGLDYLFTRLTSRGGCRALSRPYWMGSSASSLCTFLPTRWPFGRLRSGLPCRNRDDSGVGFPEFTRCYSHSFLWKLQSGVNFSMAVGAKKHALI